MHTDLVAALDIGGTKIAGALVDGQGRILVRAQRPTPAEADGDTVMRSVEAVLGELAASPLWGARERCRYRQRGPRGRLRGHGEPGERARLA
ncbi:ROK family protein [Streptomyces hirsutus]